MSGNLGAYLMAALPNVTILAFTGTPIDRSTHGRSTFHLERFGPFARRCKWTRRGAHLEGKSKDRASNQTFLLIFDRTVRSGHNS